MEKTHKYSKSVKLVISGMDCPDCARTIESDIKTRPKVADAKVDFVNGVLVAFGEDLSEIDLQKAVRALGYDAEPAPAGSSSTEMMARPFERIVPRWKLWSIFLALLIIAVGATIRHYQASLDIWRPILLLGMILAGWQIAYKGAMAARHLRLDMNFLMSAAAIGATIIGQWLEASSVIVLFSIAQLLELYSMQRSRNAIHGLINLSPKSATVIANGKEYQVPLEQIQINDMVLVKPGERIPVDGKISAGYSSIVEAAITGESMPVEKQPGDITYAGTLNGEGALEIQTSHAPGDMTLDRIIRLVEEAQAQRAPSQSFVDKFSTYYTPIVVGLAVILAVVPPLLFGATWITWIYRSLVLLVIACPCALVISTPITIVSALANAARNGILIKGGAFLENLHRMRAFAFDKTGTITQGKTTVKEVISLNGATADDLIATAAAIEARSEHPIAKAILHHARKVGARIDGVQDFKAIRGRGATGNVNGQDIFLGNYSLFQEMKIDNPKINKYLQKYTADSQSIIFIGTSHEIAGIIVLSDEIRNSAGSMVEELRSEGVRHLALLTGDNRFTGNSVSKQTGFDDIQSELLPQQKVEAIKTLRKQYGNVAMVGDGVNDAPALAAADIGIAMGVAGSDVAIETSDIALMADELEKIPWTIRLSRKAHKIIMQNIILSLGIKAAFIALAAIGAATLWMAVFADMGTSLIVIFNGMRALKLK